MEGITLPGAIGELDADLGAIAAVFIQRDRTD
jgi:hypothetical protein